MEKEKNNNVLIVPVIILSLLVVALGGYIAYDKLFDSKNDKTETNNNNLNEEINFDKLSEIGKMDYNFVSGDYNSNYSINVLFNGKVIINFEDYISNISNAKDVMLFGMDSIAYILTTNGDIYKYDLANVSKKNFEAIKIDEYSNIKRMINYKTRKAHAGGCDYIVLIDNNEKYYSLDSSCV